MDFRRYQWLTIGVIVFLLGLQIRMIDSYTLNPKSAQFMAEKFGKTTIQSTSFFRPMSMTTYHSRTIRPPQWLGWVLMSVGAVLTFHSLAVRR